MTQAGGHYGSSKQPDYPAQVHRLHSSHSLRKPRETAIRVLHPAVGASRPQIALRVRSERDWVTAR